ncbi:polymorphic toxin-type HINT domain-containing protein [Amycolatopsis sp. NPDC059657]|uniref:polymorphic toxin-type HINT domain-containing protein n=1 Tax=Amycolatopsis sp. NPDC059657 TaxID=3346899 RepID=UPI00366B515D
MGKTSLGFRRAITFSVITAMVIGLVSAPSSSADPTSATPTPSREQVVSLWHFGGPAVRAAAERALAGTDADLRAFASTELPRAKAQDDRTAVTRMVETAGPSVRQAAQQALDSTAEGALLTFLKTGWKVPAGHDQRIRVNQLMATGGPELRKAAQRALDAETVEALQEFLKTGWQSPYSNDQRIRVNQAMASGGAEVRKLAQRALDAETLEAYSQFLDHDQAIAEAHDLETATVSQLAGTARQAGEQAAVETQASKEASDRAVAESLLAQQAAEEAARAAANAQGNAGLAAEAASRAAEAADNAAAAAREAVGAANAASSAARVAASAATRAAAAATMTGKAASRAYSAAASAATDANGVHAARLAATESKEQAIAAHVAAQAADAAAKAVESAKVALTGAKSAGAHANDAARAAADAARNAAKAGANAVAAQKAAASAQANADRANRAAVAATIFADVAAEAAYQARDAANRAAADAEAAAIAANAAADHAGHSQDAARESTEHANAATHAAEVANAAVEQAKKVYDAARAADAERIKVTAEQNDEVARSLMEAEGQQTAKDRWTAAQEALRTAETNRLISEAVATGTAPAVAVADARKVAMTLTMSGGSWTKTAAFNALEGADQVALDFVRTGIAVAAGQDDRITLASLALYGTEAFQKAANDALAGDDAAVQSFLKTQDYPRRETDDRIAVNQILAAARQSGGITVQQEAQRALDAETDQALRQFLDTTQYTAAANDDRIKVNQIVSSAGSGPELKAAAQVVLDGPEGTLHQFLVVGQFQAAQRDQDSAAHNAEVAGYLAQAAQSAVLASQNANEAQRVAATARNAAEEAAGYAEQARVDAGKAATYAQQAHASAVEAENSATRAAASAVTARNAAEAAKVSATQATRSATWAKASASQAARFASDAYKSASQAFKSALAAGKDAVAAGIEAGKAVKNALGKLDTALKDEQTRQRLACAPYQIDRESFQNCLNMVTASDFQRQSSMLANGEMCHKIWKEGSPQFKACLYDSMNPSFKFDQNWQLIGQALDGLTRSAYMGLVGELGLICAAFEPCGLLALAALPEGTAFTSWMALSGLAAVDLMAMARLDAALEESMVELQLQQARMAEFSANLERLCTPGNSFTGDTKVLLADGGAKAIKDVQAGDLVLAADPRQGQVSAERVTQQIVGEGPKHLVAVGVSTPAGPAVVEATGNHPFWVEDIRAWVNAKDLKVGQKLRADTNARPVVTSVNAHNETLRVFNLTVERLHTFYVLAGDVPVLVHNWDCEIALGQQSVNGYRFALEDFAEEVSASYFQQWADDTQWYDHVLDFLANDKVRIHFNLDGIDDPIAYAKMGEFVDPAGTEGHYTNWELWEISQRPDVWDRVKFYRLGEEVENPFE